MNNKQFNIYSGLLVLALVCAVIIGISQANDPNNYTQPAGRTVADTPPPEHEDVYKLNNKTIRVVRSEDITLETLTRRLKVLNDQIERNIKRNIAYQAEIANIDRRLEVLK